MHSLVALRVPSFASCSPQFLGAEVRDSQPSSTALLLQTERSATHYPNPTGLSWLVVVAADRSGTPLRSSDEKREANPKRYRRNVAEAPQTVVRRIQFTHLQHTISHFSEE